MDFIQACQLINPVYVLTDTEKSRMIENARKNHPGTVELLKEFRKNEDQLKFYDATQKILKDQNVKKTIFWIFIYCRMLPN